jgi:hypothetical protein
MGTSQSHNEYRKSAAFCWEQAERTNFSELKADWLGLAKLWLVLMTKPTFVCDWAMALML